MYHVKRSCGLSLSKPSGDQDNSHVETPLVAAAAVIIIVLSTEECGRSINASSVRRRVECRESKVHPNHELENLDYTRARLFSAAYQSHAPGV
jgi:hypothetical protein